MSEQCVPIITEKFGELKGRDCIYLNQVIFDDNNRSLVIKGEINGNLITQENIDNEKDFPFTLTFERIIHYSTTELDTYCGLKGGDFSKSSFDEVLNSEFLANFPIRDDYEKSDFRHFLVFTYDFVFDILARDFVLEYTTNSL